MNELIFATNNIHKINEIKNILNLNFKIISLSELDFKEDIPETGKTLKENAYQKAKFISDKFNMNCFADDTGLEIEALNYRPGVYSARYAGENASYDENVEKVLNEMQNIKNRRASFRTVIALIINNYTHYFEGRIDGKITNLKMGNDGFGYDPIFIPDNYNQTFAEMELSLKNAISHRAIATQKLIEFLKNY